MTRTALNFHLNEIHTSMLAQYNLWNVSRKRRMSGHVGMRKRQTCWWEEGVIGARRGLLERGGGYWSAEGVIGARRGLLERSF
jgi:hypothetical protein